MLGIELVFACVCVYVCMRVYLQVIHQEFIEGRIGVKVDKKTLIISDFNP